MAESVLMANKCPYCNRYGEHFCSATRLPCCGEDATNPDGPKVGYNPETKNVECSGCRSVFRRVTIGAPGDSCDNTVLLQGSEPFLLIAAAERLSKVTERIGFELDHSAGLNWLQACIDAMDPGEEDERNTLHDAMDIVQEIWGSNRVTVSGGRRGPDTCEPTRPQLVGMIAALRGAVASLLRPPEDAEARADDIADAQDVMAQTEFRAHVDDLVNDGHGFDNSWRKD